MIKLDRIQQETVDRSLDSRLSIITGGPGTGKTTILKHIVSALQKQGKTFALCAPTGKAAKRMCEATAHAASTIHRLLGVAREGTGWTFMHDESRPLEVDVVIVDEASMVDVHLMASLLKAIVPKKQQLILVGDADQLPSVGPGRVLADLVESQMVSVSRLRRVYRSEWDSWVCHNAPKVLAGQMIDLEERSDFRFLEVKDLREVPDACVEVYNNKGAQILIPQKTTMGGVDAVNKHVQATVNPHTDRSFVIDDGVIHYRDPVIQTSNWYDMGVFNGDAGTVRSVKDGNAYISYSNNHLVTYSSAHRSMLRLAYALTVHKSQGSEWDHVAVVIHSSHYRMLTRRLIYTAMTRAKLSLTIIGNMDGIRAAVKCERDAKRNTRLKERIAGNHNDA